MISRGKQQYSHAQAATSKHLGCSPAATSQQAHAAQGYLFVLSEHRVVSAKLEPAASCSVVPAKQAQHAEIMDGNSQSARATDSVQSP